ncbi:hypothetical protein GOB94_15470 [Granulicella sp. 5B5]|uniref:hypothetical protein n=1 Tax=Granulicella sp. 5B5 TaxID=1617967 RepID=UPI0015F58629|nr:hypothetical protein [Granulicella sp. 5B5]QMV19921.1 hypothetical protein GOB94_15470 [Granulicella sp. 5B5]
MCSILLSRWYFLCESLDPSLLTLADRFRYGVLVCCMSAVSFVSQRGSTRGQARQCARHTLGMDRRSQPKAELGTGLWGTCELVEKNSSRIHVESGDLPDGMSTSFQIELPLAQPN